MDYSAEGRERQQRVAQEAIKNESRKWLPL